MAAKVLDDVLNHTISIESLFAWLFMSDRDAKINAMGDSFECCQTEFVSHFLNFLREQSSRIFQSSCTVETPRKNSHLRMIKNFNITPDKCSPQIKAKQNITPNTLDLESLHSFPTLSSTSKVRSYEKSTNKSSESTPVESPSKSKSKESFPTKRGRRVKLFSDHVDVKSNESDKIDISFLDDHAQWTEKENKFAASTPKQDKKEPPIAIEYFNSAEKLHTEVSPQWNVKHKWKRDGNHSADLVNNYDFKQNSANTSMPKSKSFSGDNTYRNKDHKSNSRMSLGDFILNDMSPSDNKKDKKVKAKRRINPTRVKSDDNQLCSRNDSFDDKTENSIEYRLSVEDERHLLKMECATIQEQFEGKTELKTAKELKPTKSVKVPQGTQQADPDLVTYVNELKILARIYSFLMDENLCQNLMIELCFIISLLVMRDYDMKNLEKEMKDLSIEEEPQLLNSVHNCVFFAVETLWLQQPLLSLLNQAALRLLIENTVMDKFNIELKHFLSKAYSEKLIKDNIRRHNMISKSGLQGNVSFQYETDNRENFTSDNSFHSFRKQRDLFYNILAIWEANHLSGGWVFSVGLGTKIRSLLTISSDPINLLHLARLFRSQLVMSCCGENQEESNEEILQLFPSVDPDKISRLRARLTSSPKRQGPCPLPDFVGHQEFYKEFIICSGYSLFHQYLKNSLCDEILRLNDTEFTTDLEEDDSCMDEQTHERYHQCINILRLLAKFLGFVEFLPYRSDRQCSDRVLSIHCSVRQNLLPLFDLKLCLQAAIAKHRLTLTIPWVVSYLSMIDSCSAHLDIYQQVWQILIMVYKHLKWRYCAMNSFYLKLTLGWIFQLPNFPTDLFYNVIMNDSTSVDSAISVLNDQRRAGLDSCNLVQETVLYSVCPYLHEINVILRENTSFNVRHIRPVTTQVDGFANSQLAKQLELRLEESFLQNQSSSTKKTVEFVTERVASVGIKHLIHEVIPGIKDKALADLKLYNHANLKEAESEAGKISEKCYNELVSECEKQLWRICTARAGQAVKALLSSDMESVVVDTCSQIVTRQAAEKIMRWMQSHITLAMIKREFSAVVSKKYSKKQSDAINTSMESSNVSFNKSISCKESHRLPVEGRGVIHSTEVWPASTSLSRVRELMWKIAEEGAPKDEIDATLDAAINSVLYRDDMIPVAEKTLFYLIVDLLVVICVHSETGISEETLGRFVKFLKQLDVSNYPNSSLERIICPRNVKILQTSKDKEKAWCCLGTVLWKLLDEDLLTKEQVEAQFVAFLRHNWQKSEYLQMSRLVSFTVENYKNKNGCDKFSLLMECLIDTLTDMEDSRTDT